MSDTELGFGNAEMNKKISPILYFEAHSMWQRYKYIWYVIYISFMIQCSNVTIEV